MYLVIEFEKNKQLHISGGVVLRAVGVIYSGGRVGGGRGGGGGGRRGECG